jgi:hypothetical protein
MNLLGRLKKFMDETDAKIAQDFGYPRFFMTLMLDLKLTEDLKIKFSENSVEALIDKALNKYIYPAQKRKDLTKVEAVISLTGIELARSTDVNLLSWVPLVTKKSFKARVHHGNS